MVTVAATKPNSGPLFSAMSEAGALFQDAYITEIAVFPKVIELLRKKGYLPLEVFQLGPDYLVTLDRSLFLNYSYQVTAHFPDFIRSKSCIGTANINQIGRPGLIHPKEIAEADSCSDAIENALANAPDCLVDPYVGHYVN
jgi:hypothetical protein